jgi:hypothetical protein
VQCAEVLHYFCRMVPDASVPGIPAACDDALHGQAPARESLLKFGALEICVACDPQVARDPDDPDQSDEDSRTF